MNKRYLLSLCAVVLFALALRTAVCIALSGTAAVRAPAVVTDMATYLRLAREISRGQWPSHFDYQPFYYTVLLPFCRLFSGDSPWGYMLVQTLLGSLAVLLTGLVAAQAFRSRRTGLLAALLLAISRMHVFYTPFALFELLQSFWMILLLWLAFQCMARNRLRLWAATAFILGLATLTRGNILLFLPALLLLFFRMNRTARAIPAALLLLLLFELPQLPYAIRNARFLGRWTGASTAGEKVLALGNNPEAPPGGLEYPLSYHKWVEQAERTENRVPVAREILRWLAREPVLFLNLQWEKLLLFWNAQEIPNNVSLEHEGKAAPWLALLPSFGPLALLALFAIFSHGKRYTPEQGALLVALLLFWLATAMFYILARFRVAALPLLACFAADGISRLISAARTRKRGGEWLHPLFRLCCAAFLVYSLYPLWQERMEPQLHRWLRPDGTRLRFPDTTLVHDHGPLLSGGVRFCQSKETVHLRKTLLLPEHESATSTITVRLATLPHAPANASVECQGARFTAHCRQDSACGWLEAELPLEAGTSVLQLDWILPPGVPYAIDTLRDYGRTEGAGIAGEAVAQAQFQ